MKSLKESILSSTRAGKRAFYTLFPKDKYELYYMIVKEIKEKGNKCSLNHIDTSEIRDMSFLFAHQLNKFRGDISKWDVSNVENMMSMFRGCEFNGDIFNWDVSKVENMSYMFKNSKFNKDISNWKINEKCNTMHIFNGCNIKDEYKPYKEGERIK